MATSSSGQEPTSATQGARVRNTLLWELFALAALIVLVAVLAIHKLRVAKFPYDPSWIDAWRGVRPLLSVTLPAAIKAWSIWGWVTIALAGALLKIDPALDLFDALLGGASGVWIFAYFAGMLLGPIGLFDRWALLAPLVALSVWLLLRPPRIPWRKPSTGEKLALLCVVLLAVSMLPLELGSPVPPFMDVLSYPSSVQRILAFPSYHPFNNNPYGLFGPYVQTPALELFYSMLAMAAHIHEGTLAETALMLPMATLIIFATYRLGKTFFGDIAGGMATLCLFFIPLFRRAQGMRGTAVDFALVGVGLAFFLDNGGKRVLGVFGLLALGTAVASHAIDGSLALLLAAAGALLWLTNGEYKRFLFGIGGLAGAVLVAFPEIPIALAHPLPYPILPAIQFAGAAVIVALALVAPRPGPRRQAAKLAARAVAVALPAAFILFVALRHHRDAFNFYAGLAGIQPFLVVGCVVAMLILAILPALSGDAVLYGTVVALALMFGAVNAGLIPLLQHFGASLSYKQMSGDFASKLSDYWCPYFLTLPAGLLAAWAYRYVSSRVAMLALIVIIIYPWRLVPHPTDYDGSQHSISEQWAFNLDTAAHGYWGGTRDRRWTMDANGKMLVSLLNRDIRSAKITRATYILHLTDNINYWVMFQFPAFTGIYQTVVERRDDRDSLWNAGGRVHWITDLAAQMAKHPPYVLDQMNPPAWPTEPPKGYKEIFNRGSLRLFKREGS